MDRVYLARMDRQLACLGEDGQEMIHATRLCVVGSGGSGSLTGVAAALMGFGHITIVDPDELELSNMNRSFLWGDGVARSIGRRKAEILAETALRVDPCIETQSIVERVESPKGTDALHSSDAVALCVDENEPRVFVNSECADLQVPVLDLGTGGMLSDDGLSTFGWRASFFWPGGACLRCIYLDDTSMSHSRISYAPLNLQVVGVGLDMLVAHLTGYRGIEANHIVCDLVTGRLVQLMIQGRAGCPYCGSTRMACQQAEG